MFYFSVKILTFNIYITYPTEMPQALPFHPNTRTHDDNTRIKHNIHHPIAKHIFSKSCVRFGIPRIVNDCPNSILDKINTHSFQTFSVYIKTHFL